MVDKNIVGLLILGSFVQRYSNNNRRCCIFCFMSSLWSCTDSFEVGKKTPDYLYLMILGWNLLQLKHCSETTPLVELLVKTEEIVFFFSVAIKILPTIIKYIGIGAIRSIMCSRAHRQHKLMEKKKKELLLQGNRISQAVNVYCIHFSQENKLLQKGILQASSEWQGHESLSTVRTNSYRSFSW